MFSRKCPACGDRLSVRFVLKMWFDKQYRCPKCNTILVLNEWFILYQVGIFISVSAFFRYTDDYFRLIINNKIIDFVIQISVAFVFVIIMFYYLKPIKYIVNDEKDNDNLN